MLKMLTIPPRTLLSNNNPKTQQQNKDRRNQRNWRK